MKKIVLGIMATLWTMVPAFAQKESAGIRTGAANFLTIPTDARSAGLGGAEGALPNANCPIFSNGAMSVWNTNRLAFGYSYAPVLRDLESGHTLHSVGGFYQINRHHVLLAGFRYYRYPEFKIKLPDSDYQLNLQPKEWSIELGHALKVTSHFSVSSTIRLICSDMGQLAKAKRAYACAFDIGLAYQKSFDFCHRAQWNVGLQASNFGTRIRYTTTHESLPTLFKLGGSVNVDITPQHGLLVTTDWDYRCSPNDTQSLQLTAGAEYSCCQLLKLRGGYHYGDKNKGDCSYTTAGAGLHYQGVQVDFAWLFAKDMPINHSYWLSIGYAF